MSNSDTPAKVGSMEGFGAWSRSAPTVAGWYWVWQDEGTWPCHGRAHCVFVENEQSRLRAWVPYMDYADGVVCSDDENTWLDAWWLGPVAVPDAPNDRATGLAPKQEQL